MSSIATIAAHPNGGPDAVPRRNFLNLVTLATAAIGVGAVAWPFIDSMNPAKDTLAAGNPIDIDTSRIEPGQQIVVLWRGAPMFVMRRSPQAIAALQDPAMIARLKDPDSTVMQQPSYAKNWHRSTNPEYAVLVGICTHLGCLPTLYSKPSETEPVVNWPGGYFCHCHGSKYDLAGRVHTNVPAPYNLPVPPYTFVKETMLRIGENPPGETFDLNSVVQI
jgi:ubiquinol-cytochrome c reductase iron-sulfur subunit